MTGLIGNPLAVAWKMNNAQGISFVKNENGDMEIVEFPGPLPTQADLTEWSSAWDARNAILSEIARLEATVTPRRLREAALTDAGKAWLAEVDAAIAAERSKL